MINKNLQNLKVLLSAMETDHLSKTDFTKYFEQVVNLVKKIEAKNLQEMAEFRTLVESVKNKLNTDNSTTSDKLNRQISAELESLLRRFSAKSKEIDNKVDNKLASVRDGLDADEEVIVEKVLAQIKLPEYKETILDTPEQLRDKLETLQGEKEIRITAIEELKKEIEELKKRPLAGRTPYGGSVVHKFMDDETPVGTVNGTNADIRWAKAPIGLKVYVNGQKMTITEDYTQAGRVTTFLTAPPTGSIIRGDYRYF